MSTTIASDHPFTPEQQTLMRTLAGMIVPASATYEVPGADDDLIFADLLNSATAQVDEVRAALEVAESLGEPSAHQTELQMSEAFAPLVVLVMQCYYRDDRVMRSLGMEARAPYPKGFEVEQGDWSLLEPVQQRGKIWRDA